MHVCKKALPVCVLPEPTINCPPLYYRSSLSTAPLHVCLCVLPKSTMNCTLCTVWASYQLPLCTCVRGHHLESGCSAFSSVLPVVTIDCPFCTACPHHQPPHLYCLFPSWIASLCNACPHHQLPPFLLAVPIIKCTLCNAFPCHQLHPVYCLIYYTTDTNLHSNTLSSHWHWFRGIFSSSDNTDAWRCFPHTDAIIFFLSSLLVVFCGYKDCEIRVQYLQ